jgi:translation initiation factor 2-alpha kinase 4
LKDSSSNHQTNGNQNNLTSTNNNNSSNNNLNTLPSNDFTTISEISTLKINHDSVTNITTITTSNNNNNTVTINNNNNNSSSPISIQSPPDLNHNTSNGRRLTEGTINNFPASSPAKNSPVVSSSPNSHNNNNNSSNNNNNNIRRFTEGANALNFSASNRPVKGGTVLQVKKIFFFS